VRYRVREGHTFGSCDQHPSGALVELSARDALPFLDKLEPLGDVPDTGEDGMSLDSVSSDALSGDALSSDAPAGDAPAGDTADQTAPLPKTRKRSK
jgi:hypothetical protein